MIAPSTLEHALYLTRGIRDQDLTRVRFAAMVESYEHEIATLRARLAAYGKSTIADDCRECADCSDPTALEDLIIGADSLLRCPACQSEHDDAEADRWEDARDRDEQQRCDEALDARRGL